MDQNTQVLKKYIINLDYNKPQYSIGYGKNKDKNKKIIYIKDGYCTYKVIIVPMIECNCSGNINKLCNHIIYVLMDIYKLSENSILYLNNIYDFFIDNVDKNSVDPQQIDNKIYDFFSQDSCGICLNKLSDSKQYLQFYTCKQCKKIIHVNCAIEWFKKQKTCVYCRDIIE